MMTEGEEASLPKDPERQYYSRYEWCLSPALPVRVLRTHLEDEWQGCNGGGITWQQDEARVNLYLFLSALHCSGADYLAAQPFGLSALNRRLGRAQSLTPLLKGLVNGPHRIANRAAHRTVEVWQGHVERCLGAICRILLDEPRFGAESRATLETTLPTVINSKLPEPVLRWRMRIPEAFRCQDLTHLDVFRLADRLAEREDIKSRPTFILGPRTAGAYFAPLVEAYLVRAGLPTLGWLSIRPKVGLTTKERRLVEKALKAGGRIVVVDDHPNSGDTFALILKILRPLGAEPTDVLILAPQHPAEVDWSSKVQPVETIRLRPTEFYKFRLLGDDERLLTLAREFNVTHGWQDLEVVRSSECDEVNRALDAQFGYTFQTRMKRVIEVRGRDEDGHPQTVRILFKSVGWGWLAYHGYLAGMRLKGDVPELIGLREGLLALEWVGPLDPALPAASEEACRAVVAEYVAQRTKTLRVPEDPWMAPGGYRGAGWDRMLRSLRYPLGTICGKVAGPLLKRELRGYATPFPTLVDGRMKRENWLATPLQAVKCDFEHHNFGGGEEDFVDSAIDLAGAIFEMNIAPAEEDRIIEAYIGSTGDEEVRARLLLFKLHVGHTAMADASYYCDRNIDARRRASENLRYLAGRNFLTYQFNRHNANRIERPTEVKWSRRLFFLDLDGVFDTQELIGFPHSTTKGLIALSLLRKNGYSIVPNTGRSVEHVRNYCEQFSFPAGVAEYGCVLVDRVRGCETVLVEEGALAELARCREAFLRRELLVDPGYKVAVRTYDLKNEHMVGPTKADLEAILEQEGLQGLEVLVTSADGYVLPKGLGKKRGVEAIVGQLGREVEFVAAMGDSKADIEMLQSADIAYAPLNSDAEVQTLTRTSDKVRLMRASNQQGLLEAVMDLLERRHGQKIDVNSGAGVRRPDHLIDRILDLVDVPESQRLRRIVRARLGSGRLPGWEAHQ